MRILFRYFCLVFCGLCITETQAAFVVVGETQRLTESERVDIYKTLASNSLPDIGALSKQFENKRINFIFTPDTTYHVLESELIDHVVGRITPPHSKNPRIAYRVQERKNNYAPQNTDDLADFWALNAHIASFGKTSLELENKARDILQGPSFIKDLLPLNLYNTIISLEKDAYDNEKILLWRFSNGLFKWPDWIDSFFDMSSLNGQSKPCFRGDLSYSAYPLDHCIFDHFQQYLPTDLFENLLPSRNTPSSALLILWYNRSQIQKLKKMALTQEVQNRLEALKKHTLYALSIPRKEWESWKPAGYVLDCSDSISCFTCLRAKGDHNHHRIYPHRENLEQPSIISEAHGTFIRVFYRWMAEHMTVLFTNNEFVSDPADVKHIRDTYHTFYTDQLPGILRQLGDTRPLEVKSTAQPSFLPLSSAHKKASLREVKSLVSAPAPTAMKRLEQLAENSLVRLHQDKHLLCAHLLLTGKDPLTNYEYGFRVKGPSANHQEKREIITALVADVVYNYKKTQIFVEPHVYRTVFNRIEKEAFPYGFSAYGQEKGYSEREVDKINHPHRGHQVLIRSCIYAISAILQNQEPQWNSPLRRRYFDDLYASAEPKVHSTFTSFVNAKGKEFGFPEHDF